MTEIDKAIEWIKYFYQQLKPSAAKKYTEVVVRCVLAGIPLNERVVPYDYKITVERRNNVI